MPITFYCPLGHRISAPRSKAGREIRCPVCDHRVVVPEVAGEGAAAGKSESALASSDVVEPGSAGREAETNPDPPPVAIPELAPPMPGRPTWRSWLRGEGQLMSANTYRPGRDRIQAIRWLAFFSALVAAFGGVAAWDHLNLEIAPGWARVALLLAVLQGFYIVWMLATPDWSSVWVVALVFAFVAALYGLATVVALATPLDRPLPLDMEAVRHFAPRWCGSALLLNALFAYLCGSSSVKWRRSHERETGARSRP